MTPRLVEVQAGAVLTLLDIVGFGSQDTIGMPIVELANREWSVAHAENHS
jgi:hypothetical protein